MDAIVSSVTVSFQKSNSIKLKYLYVLKYLNVLKYVENRSKENFGLVNLLTRK